MFWTGYRGARDHTVNHRTEFPSEPAHRIPYWRRARQADCMNPAKHVRTLSAPVDKTWLDSLALRRAADYLPEEQASPAPWRMVGAAALAGQTRRSRNTWVWKHGSECTFTIR